MKEAAGEANMTVITIVLIGVVAAAGLLLVPKLMKNMNKKSCCTDAGGIWSNNGCKTAWSGQKLASSFNSCMSGLK